MFRSVPVISSFALLTALGACAHAQSPQASSSQIEITADMPTSGTNLIDLYKYFHTHPELSFKEVKSSTIMANELTSLGFEVTTGLGDEWTRAKSLRDNGVVRDGVGGYGVVGVYRNGEGPTVLIRADMDALPVAERTGVPHASKVVDETWTGVTNGVMHACGHDIHMTSWVGTARNLIAAKDEWSGTLVMIAQPAEELGNGAQAMIADGLFERFPLPDYNLALHVSASVPSGKVAYSSGFALANVDSVDITVKGVGGHGAYPHTTKDPVIVGASIVTAVQTLVSRNVNPQTPAVVTVGSFQAGAKHNIISDEAKLLLTVRSYDDETRSMLLEGIERIAKAQALAFGAPEPEIFIEPDYTPSTYNEPALAAKAAAAIADVIGAENIDQVDPVMGGEDFSQYGRTDANIPGLIFWVGAVEPGKWQAAQDSALGLPSLHSPFFAPDYEPTIETGVKSMTASALALFNDE
ncbi:MAG: amidohydrolase [Hyphomonas sp.]|jgi:amidohydrolase|nr:amidohydrolase [Henriciella sp.]MBO6696129.1 amidohydrolase [Henriciella sp.]MCR9225372.1 amidohydrolase [Hyphomonas sp.]